MSGIKVCTVKDSEVICEKLNSTRLEWMCFCYIQYGNYVMPEHDRYNTQD
jgi:hypothetical protein